MSQTPNAGGYMSRVVSTTLLSLFALYAAGIGLIGFIAPSDQITPAGKAGMVGLGVLAAAVSVWGMFRPTASGRWRALLIAFVVAVVQLVVWSATS